MIVNVKVLLCCSSLLGFTFLQGKTTMGEVTGMAIYIVTISLNANTKL